jgi:hypothetical protein
MKASRFLLKIIPHSKTSGIGHYDVPILKHHGALVKGFESFVSCIREAVNTGRGKEKKEYKNRRACDRYGALDSSC